MITESPVITADLIESGLTYEQYVALSTELFARQRTTSESPAYNTAEILGYTKLNLHRMSRIDKLTVVNNELKTAIETISQPWVWLVLTESWCGDAAQLVPVLHKVAELSPEITLRFLLRDKNPDLMNAYLTNGGKSIPKLICLRASDNNYAQLQELGTWGPRPAALQTLMSTWRQENISFEEVVERAQRWYNEDHTYSTQRELLALVESWSKVIL